MSDIDDLLTRLDEAYGRAKNGSPSYAFENMIHQAYPVLRSEILRLRGLLSDARARHVESPGPYSRRSDPTTSREAALGIAPKVNKLEAAVLEVLASGPACCLGISIKLGAQLQSITPRMRPLANRGLVVDTGKRTGTPKRIVWALAAGHVASDPPATLSA